MVPLPDPCPHRPGSPGKIEALRLRVELGQQLHHPLDEQIPIPHYAPIVRYHRPSASVLHGMRAEMARVFAKT